MFDARTSYHDIRRAVTSVSGKGDNRRAYHPYTLKDGRRLAKTVKLPRGHADFRDEALRAILARQQHPAPTLQQRLNRFIADKYSDEIERRGGETTIEEKNGVAVLHVVDRRVGERLVLLKAEGWRHYSNRFGARHASIAYLCGQDDNGSFAVRVPGTVKTIAEAIDAIEPAEVKKARLDQRKVLRQGDVYVVEMIRDRADQADLPPRHKWDAETRTLRHEDGHGSLHCPFACKFIVQSTLRMGRLTSRTRRGRGD